ncbi:bifunctional helix-turn-helix transcriptional regulator/GNAT family N-acetyltransferase [Candidimonas nitroreducens]|uniref:MarR family transcriptional regulator n=1 Tax=Candidimonas nitroreducens TaxID=683354 RepID=A0A225MLR4_9BURK|nr:bifunctional helix-turn-helix transcriptional regulator/GNAT family N-acetyltransferase [Candidimonas nitroreducens]OWT62105.1 MarR family transcriptional regulator [Candidimonas nitroreducens]
MTAAAVSILDQQIAVVRGFSRFYTRLVGLLNEGILKSAYSLTEVRILFELAHRDSLSASDLVRELGLDAGYLSRVLKRFEARGLLARSPAPQDARQTLLALTAAGRKAFEPLDRASHDEISQMLQALDAPGRDRLVKSMQAIERLLGGRAEPAVPYVLRPLQSGDIGWITHRQGVLYNQEYGWDETFEALVAQILAKFVEEFDPRRERAWVAEREGEVVGSIFVVKESDAVAKLRLLYVEPSARGLGIGRRLVDECIAFARAKGYTRMVLWTNDVLVSARRIYQAAGFQLVEQERHHSFGKDLVGQNWALDL